MFSIFLQPTPQQEDGLIADLWEQGTAGIIEERSGLRAFFEDGCDARALLRHFAAFAPEFRSEPSRDWEQVMREAWPPLTVGQRFFLVAPWSSAPAPEGRLRLEIYPGMACGTGRHPATQLCLEAMERYVRPGDRVLDVGTGSGILVSAASLLGAGQVIGCDVDHEAVRIARERAGSPLFTGSADAVRTGWADVIVANIDSAGIERLAGEFARVRHADSTLILAGFPEWDQPEGFRAKDRLQREEWICLIC